MASNPIQEPAFEASIYHYFLFKANQAATTLNRDETEQRQNDSSLKVLASTAASNDEKASSSTTNDEQKDADGDAKMAAVETPSEKEGGEKSSTGSGQKNATEQASKSPASASTETNKPAPPAGPPIAPRLPPMGTLPGPRPQAAGVFPGMAPRPPGVQPPMRYPYPSDYSLGLLGPRLGSFPVPGMNAPPMMMPLNPAPGGGTKTAADSSKTSPADDVSASHASNLQQKYNRIASVINEEFPAYANMIPPNAPFLAPDISMRYAHFLPVHSEVGLLRQRVHGLEQQLFQQQAQNRQMQGVASAAAANPSIRKRGRPVTGNYGTGKVGNNATVPYDPTAPPPKRPYAMTESVRKRIHKRADVPDDVKEHVARLKKEASNDKRNLRQKIGRLEKQLSKAQTKLNDAETKAKMAPKPPPPALQEPKPAPVAALPRSPPKPVEPPATFDSRFQELLDYQRANNTVRVPGRIPGLGRWVSELRKLYKISKDRPEILKPREFGPASDLTHERIARLTAIGFEWEVAPKMIPWQDRFEQVVAYKEKYGTTMVPRAWKENPSLGEWVHMQRKLYKQNSKVLQGERMDKLNSIGFVWSGPGKTKLTWEERVEECRNFRRQHGHLSVPPPVYPRKGESEAAAAAHPQQTAEEKSFAQWCQRQRDAYRKNKAGKKTSLDNKRQKQLDDLGFDWMDKPNPANRGGSRGKIPNEEIYNEQVSKLQRVKDLYGDCNDVKDIEKVFPDDKKLLYWMKSQRKQYKYWKNGQTSSLSTARRQTLEALGFNFTPRAHYAPYGSKKKEAAADAETRAGMAAMQAAAEAAAELEHASL